MNVAFAISCPAVDGTEGVTRCLGGSNEGGWEGSCTRNKQGDTKMEGWGAGSQEHTA